MPARSGIEVDLRAASVAQDTPRAPRSVPACLEHQLELGLRRSGGLFCVRTMLLAPRCEQRTRASRVSRAPAPAAAGPARASLGVRVARVARRPPVRAPNLRRAPHRGIKRGSSGHGTAAAPLVQRGSDGGACSPRCARVGAYLRGSGLAGRLEGAGSGPPPARNKSSEAFPGLL